MARKKYKVTWRSAWRLVRSTRSFHSRFPKTGFTNRFPVNSLAQPQFRKGTHFTSLFIDQSAVFALCRRHDVSTLPLTLINTSRALGTRLVPRCPRILLAWVEKRDHNPFEHRLKVLEPIFEQQIRIYNAKRLWVFPPNTFKTVFSPETVNIKKLANLTANTKNYRQITLNTKPHSDPLQKESSTPYHPTLFSVIFPCIIRRKKDNI